MRIGRQAAPKWIWQFGMDTGLFFLLFYLYVWLILDPRLIDHGVGILSPYFSLSYTTGWPFLREHLLRPGGLVEYGARFLSPFFSVGWLGALFVTAAAWSTCLSVDALTRLAGLPRGIAVRLGPPVLLLLMYANYSQPLRTILSLLVALAWFGIYLRLAPQGRGKRLAVVLFLCVVVNHVAGSGSLLFPILVAIHEILIRGRRRAGLAVLLCGLCLPGLLGRTLYDVTDRVAYGDFIPSVSGATVSDWLPVLVLYLYFPAVLAGFTWYGATRARNMRRSKSRASAQTRPSWLARGMQLLRNEESSRGMRTVAVFLMVGVIAWFLFDAPGKIVLQTDYFCRHERWAEALEAAARMPSHPYNANFNRSVMLALYHTDRLGEEMFRYPQSTGIDLYAHPEGDASVLGFLQESRFFMELGEINRAERYACEALSGTGDLPVVLERLAMIHILKDRPETARIFLHALSKKPIRHRAAEEVLRRLEQDPRLEADPTLNRLRQVMLHRDSVAPRMNVEVTLLRLLEENRRNKMAFDFLMAHYLLAGRPDQIVANLQYLPDFGYHHIPRHFQEAVVVQASATEDWSLTEKYEIPPEILGQGVLLEQIRGKAANKEEAMKKAVAAGLGDSYIFFLMFGRSGLSAWK